MRTLYVIDNGEQYSDHAIFFVDDQYPIEVVKTVVALVLAKGKLDGVGTFEWWEGCWNGTATVSPR
jgi:hypothetical protein